MKAWASSQRRAAPLALVLVLAALVTGCAAPSRTLSTQEGEAYWAGRLSLQVQSEPPQSVNAGFELTGQAQAGELRISSPLGQNLARLRWSPERAELQRGQESITRDSLPAMVKALTGTDLPVQALFDWLHGRSTAAPGWEVDLSQHASGRITARRLSPPTATLRLLLER